MKGALIVIPIAIGLVFLGAAWVGIVNIPGISPESPAVAKKAHDKQSTGTTIPLEPLPAKVPIKVDETDPEKGHAKIAHVWEGIETDKLLLIVSKWRDAELVPVLSRMDQEKVAALLSAMDAAKAAKLSKELQAIVSRPPTLAQ